MLLGQNVPGKPFTDWIFDDDTADFPKTVALEVHFIVPGPWSCLHRTYRYFP